MVRSRNAAIARASAWASAIRLDRRAVTAIEYALIAGLIALVIVAGVIGIGTNLSAIFNNVSPEL